MSKFSVWLNSLTEDTSPDLANDFLVTYDASAATAKKLKPSNLGGAVVASGAEIDTGTDNTKFASAKAIKDAHNVPSVAPSTSGNVLTSNGTDWTSAAPAAGGRTLITELTPAGGTTASFTSIPGTY